VAFTAFAWLLTVEPAHRVASYALVNPVVAVGLGAWLGHETIGPRVWIALPLIGIGLALHLLTADRTGPATPRIGAPPSGLPAERGSS
jgi:drug/metabolite transporter (DMT)-like permease